MLMAIVINVEYEVDDDHGDAAADDDDDDDDHEGDRSQGREVHFARAIAVEMHTEVSQEQFRSEITLKCQMPIPRHSFWASLCSQTARRQCTRAACFQIFKKTATDTSGDIGVSEPVQLTCTWTCHEIHVAWKFSRKMLHALPTESVLCELKQLTCT